MTYRQTFTVRGTGTFPYDMLRYDHCWPEKEAESDRLDSNKMLHDDNYFSTPRDVSLVRYVDSKHDFPTSGRWHSFGWQVVEETVSSVKR